MLAVLQICPLNLFLACLAVSKGADLWPFRVKTHEFTMQSGKLFCYAIMQYSHVCIHRSSSCYITGKQSWWLTYFIHRISFSLYMPCLISLLDVFHPVHCMKLQYTCYVAVPFIIFTPWRRSSMTVHSWAHTALQYFVHSSNANSQHQWIPT